MKPAVLILLFGTAMAAAQEDFVPPENYPVDRYEAAWKKNPFTLKTAPIAIEKISFAKDLALGAVYQIGDDTTVVVVNTKTRERFKLVNDQPSSEGLKVKAVYHKDTRKETYVEVEAGGELATLRYDENYQKQMVGQQPAAPGMPPGAPIPGMPAMNNGGVQNARPQAPPFPAAPPSAPSNALPTKSNAPGMPRAPGMNGPAGFPPSNVPTPSRRRLLTAPVAPISKN